MRVLVTGAAGMLAQDLARALQARGHEVLARSREQLDVTDPAAVQAAVLGSRPDAVANCAAFNDVDGAEDDEAGAMRVNDHGAGLLAAAAAEVGAKVLYPSSDYVFDGAKGEPYVESDITAPLSAYGRSKLAGETSVAVTNPRHFIVRTAWLFGLGRRNFVETMLRLADEQPEVLVVSDQVGCPTYTPHLAEAMAMMLESDEFGIHHVAGGGACSWYEFAHEIFDQADLDCRVMAATSELLARKAPRPAYSVLRSERPDAFLLPAWREGLSQYLAARSRAAAGAAEGHA